MLFSQFKSRGTLCREATNECDLPEYCSGNHEMVSHFPYLVDHYLCENNNGCIYRIV